MERRLAARRVPGARDPQAHLRLRIGTELSVIDLSDRGALVESTARILPGSHLEIQLVVKEERILVKALVLRCAVVAVSPQRVVYRGAISFERAVDTSQTG